jgi:hypothetical protein
MDDFVKNPISANRCAPRQCGVRTGTPPSSGLASFDLGLFTKSSESDFFETIDIVSDKAGA